MKKKNSWSLEEDNYLRESYPNRNVSVEDISRELNRGIRAIVGRASILKLPERKYPLNYCYFDIMDSWEKWYILGWLYSDGCNTDLGSIIISIQEQDCYILHWIKEQLSYGGELLYSVSKKETAHHKATLSIRNKYMSNILRNLGVVSRKSLVLEFPKNIPKQFESAFLLGCFDGDGCVYLDRKGFPYFSFIGTLNMCKNFQRILIENCGLNENKLVNNNVNKNTYILTYGGLQLDKIKDFLYKDALMYLKRKFDKFEKGSNYIPKRKDRVKVIWNDKIIFSSLAEAYKNTGIDPKTIKKYIKNKEITKQYGKWNYA